MLVNLGIRLAYLTRKIAVTEEKKISRYVFMSNKMNENLKQTVTKEVVLMFDLENIKNNDEIIFDANIQSYKSIIDVMDDENRCKSLTYKILPNKSTFIIGSNNAISKGKVIAFKEF